MERKGVNLHELSKNRLEEISDHPPKALLKNITFHRAKTNRIDRIGPGFLFSRDITGAPALNIIFLSGSVKGMNKTYARSASTYINLSRQAVELPCEE